MRYAYRGSVVALGVTCTAFSSYILSAGIQEMTPHGPAPIGWYWRAFFVAVLVSGMLIAVSAAASIVIDLARQRGSTRQRH